MAAIRSNRYVHVKELYVWDIPMKHEDIATLVCNVYVVHALNQVVYFVCHFIFLGFT